MIDRDTTDYYIGADPGISGAFALVQGGTGNAIDIIRGDWTEYDQYEKLKSWNKEFLIRMCMVEEVTSRPMFVNGKQVQGIASTFKFGKSFGFMIGLLVATEIRHIFVRPSVWQTEMRCRTKGDKNITKAAAQRIFPGQITITHRNADALLLAECCRRRYHDPGPAKVRPKIRRRRK